MSKERGEHISAHCWGTRCLLANVSPFYLHKAQWSADVLSCVLCPSLAVVCLVHIASLAQLVEHALPKRMVMDSIPTGCLVGVSEVIGGWGVSPTRISDSVRFVCVCDVKLCVPTDDVASEGWASSEFLFVVCCFFCCCRLIFVVGFTFLCCLFVVFWAASEPCRSFVEGFVLVFVCFFVDVGCFFCYVCVL